MIYYPNKTRVHVLFRKLHIYSSSYLHHILGKVLSNQQLDDSLAISPLLVLFDVYTGCNDI